MRFFSFFKAAPVNIEFTINIALSIALILTVISVFVPFSPLMPRADLDGGWELGMNEFVAQGFSFGRDIFFTFGPYASIYTQMYHPSTDFMMLAGSLYVALSYGACLFVLMRGVKKYWILIFCVFLAGFLYSRDTLLFSLPLLVGLTCFKMISSDGGRHKSAPFYVALLFAPLGLLPLIKGSIIFLCAATAILCSLFFLVNRQKFLAVLCLLSPGVSLLLFWMASGQSVANLPDYFLSMIPIVSGYTEAMAFEGNDRVIKLYVFVSITIFITIFLQTQIPQTTKIFLSCLYFIFLFISFKAGFVRHDTHTLISGSSILFAALSLRFIIHSKAVTFNSMVVFPVVLFALLGWFQINFGYFDRFVVSTFTSTYTSSWQGLKNRTENSNWPRSAYDATLNLLRTEVPIPTLPGTTDIYSYQQSYLIASGNTWSPRPVFQSYSAYTPELARLNKRHLLGNKAPDNIIFKVETIDNRLPSLDDGASWPLLMSHYKPTRLAYDFLFLRRKENIAAPEKPIKFTTATHKFGEKITLPSSDHPLFAQINIRPTVLGRVVSFLFKPSQLWIRIELKNGTKKQYRIVAGMTQSGFVISPLIENTTEFRALYGEDGGLLDKSVHSIRIGPRGGGDLFWETDYTLQFGNIIISK